MRLRNAHAWFLCTLLSTMGLTIAIMLLIFASPEAWPVWLTAGVLALTLRLRYRPAATRFHLKSRWIPMESHVWYRQGREQKVRVPVHANRIMPASHYGLG
jgi:hypothetical protein